MEKHLVTAGRVVGILGTLLCVIAMMARATGNFYVGGFSALALVQAGTSGVVIGCFLLLLARAPRS